jgi:hypothetical protein
MPDPEARPCARARDDTSRAPEVAWSDPGGDRDGESAASAAPPSNAFRGQAFNLA